MDQLSALLDGPTGRATSALRVVLDPPFGIRVQDEAPLALICLVTGELTIEAKGVDRQHLRAGDVAVVRGPLPYIVRDRPGSTVRTVILPGNRSATLDGDELCDVMDLGVRAWGDRPEGGTVMLIGTWSAAWAVSSSLLAALPQVIVLRSQDWDTRLVTLLAEEIRHDAPGQDAVLDRVLDLLLVTGLRAWLTRTDSPGPDWYRGRRDPAVAASLTLIHDEPAHPWTVASLARRVGVSRATLARRFTELVGEPPMTYLARWRLALAADLLREPDSTVAAVAHQVGYGSGFALSAAFKRVRGVTPQQHRAG